MELLAKNYSSLKRAEIRNYKRNLYQMYIELAHWLTKNTNKESTFHNIATFHTTIPT